MEHHTQGNPGSSLQATVDPAEALVEAYVTCLKEAFIHMKKTLNPAYRGPGVRLHSRWVTLAKELASNQLDPYSYVKFVFDEVLANFSDVHQEMVTSRKYLDLFLKMRPEEIEKAKRLVEWQKETLATRIKNRYSLSEALTDPYIGFTPAFRFAAAYSEGLWEVAEANREAAMLELMFEPEFKKALAQWLPKEMQ